MRKLGYYLLAVVLVAAAAAVIIVAAYRFKNHNDNVSSNTSSVTSQSAARRAKQACGIFTLADAKRLLGSNAKGGNTNDTANGTSANLDVSDCTYTQDTGGSATVATKQSASLIVRAPKNAAGAAGDRRQFSDVKPDTKPVSSYGDSAYWDTQLGQLNILKNNIWYTLSYGPTNPAGRTPQQAERLAGILINRL